jgi:hypothetical protein
MEEISIIYEENESPTSNESVTAPQNFSLEPQTQLK